ncbi:MAG: hypothetical protein NT076_03750 [Candidatus Pacearchaeota archaeon]|nr:hypothetical protein [Candidatus Pacearchaeota archaeon]
MIIGAYWLFHSLSTASPYYFILNGSKTDEVMQCENLWHYENLSFIPCFLNGSLGGIFNSQINYSLSPQDNCALYNWTFPGFNVENETRAKELYDKLLPRCFPMYSKDINEEFLKELQCLTGNQTRCEEWKDDGLIIRRNRWKI